MMSLRKYISYRIHYLHDKIITVLLLHICICSQSESVSHACPICRTEPFKTYPDHAVDREIKGLKIYCRNKEVGYGCSWSGESDQIDVHLNKCEIACKYCKELIHYTAMISHINECLCYWQY